MNRESELCMYVVYKRGDEEQQKPKKRTRKEEIEAMAAMLMAKWKARDAVEAWKELSKQKKNA